MWFFELLIALRLPFVLIFYFLIFCFKFYVFCYNYSTILLKSYLVFVIRFIFNGFVFITNVVLVVFSSSSNAFFCRDLVIVMVIQNVLGLHGCNSEHVVLNYYGGSSHVVNVPYPRNFPYAEVKWILTVFNGNVVYQEDSTEWEEYFSVNNNKNKNNNKVYSGNYKSIYSKSVSYMAFLCQEFSDTIVIRAFLSGNGLSRSNIVYEELWHLKPYNYVVLVPSIYNMDIPVVLLVENIVKFRSEFVSFVPLYVNDYNPF